VRIEQLEHRASPPATTLWCGAPEGDRADWLIEKLAELGLGAFLPVETARTRWEIAPRRAERWARLARAALQQSCGAWLLDMRTPVPLEVALAEPPADIAWLADPAGDRASGGDAGGAWVGITGPSSGFTDRERDSMIARGLTPISLGGRRLRTETAALALTVLWTAASGRA
jgi:16S rRNA (uracil1498-N3)-methyltransferase